MNTPDRSIFIATRGSALALAQSNMILAQCRAAFPQFHFDLRIIKTTGDKLQTASMAKEGETLPKGLFTKELEVALLDKTADLAVHSLKDLPTELPSGLVLGAVGKREDVRDVLLYRAESTSPALRGFAAGMALRDFPADAVIATSSTRRKAQILVQNPQLKVPDIRGNVLTRMQKLAQRAEMDATILALAGLSRLRYSVQAGSITGEGVPPGLRAEILDTEAMLPCVGQGAIGIEIRAGDGLLEEICQKLNHFETHQSVLAERAFLAGMGGGCQSPVAAHAQVQGDQIRMRALSFAHGPVRRTEASGSINNPLDLGRKIAAELKG